MSEEHHAKLIAAIDAARVAGADPAIETMKAVALRAEVEPGYKDTMWLTADDGYVTRYCASIDTNGVALIEALYGATDLPKYFQRVV